MPEHDEIIRAMDSLPPLPAVALRVIQVAQDPRSSASDLALVVSADPGLTGRTLAMANSAAYRRSRTVTSVQDALVVLGFVQARNVAVSTAITSAFPPDPVHALFRIDEFWRHSLAVAFKAFEVAGRSPKVDAASAFTAGILHDIGRLAMFYAQPAGLDQAVARVVAGDGTPEAIELEQLHYDHAELGAKLAGRWRLPATMSEAIGLHHAVDPDPETLPGIIALADRYCMDVGFLPGYIVPAPLGTHPHPPADVERLAKQVDELMDLIREGGTRGVRVA